MDLQNSIERDKAFEELLGKAKPDPEILIPTKAGALLVFATEPSAEKIRAIIREHGKAVDQFKTGGAAPEDWLPYRSRSRAFLGQALFLAGSMKGFFRSYREVNDDEDEAKTQYVGEGEMLPAWSQAQWFKFQATAGYVFNAVWDIFSHRAVGDADRTFFAEVAEEKNASGAITSTE